MKIVASHQPHFFPWLGYFDKMAKVDLFLINDVVQLESKSPMVRNKIIDREGKERYLNVIIDKSGYIEKQNGEILLKDWDNTKKSLLGKVRNCYLYADYFDQAFPLIKEILDKDYKKLIELDIDTIEMGRQCLGITTPIMFQSALQYKEGSTTSERLAEKLCAVKTDIYLSGNGGRNYMDLNDYSTRGIHVVFQKFSYPIYPQLHKGEFVPNLSFLDLIFNCGIDMARDKFWDNVRSSNEINLI